MLLPGKITHQLLVGGGDGITEIEGEGREWQRQTSFPCGSRGATVISGLVFIWGDAHVPQLEGLENCTEKIE